MNGRERYFNIIILIYSWCSGRIAEWSEAALFSLEEVGVQVQIPGCQLPFFFFLSSFFSPFGFLLFISSRGGTIRAIYTRKKKACPAYIRRVLIVLNKMRTSPYKRQITSNIRHNYLRTGVKGYP